MAVESNTRWGREFEGISVDEGAAESADAPWSDVAECLSSGRWNEAVQSLATCYVQDPVRGVEALELASCAHLAAGLDLRGAVARARFAVGCVADRSPWDALGKALSERLLDQDDGPWAALALLDHSEGLEHLAAQVREGELDGRWLRQDGLDALENLVFQRADESDDPGWVALSAMLAAQDSGDTFEEETTLRTSRRVADDNPRAWGVELQVLFSLDHDDVAEALVARALEAFEDQPRALLEILDTTNMDAELEPLLVAVEQHDLARRSSTDRRRVDRAQGQRGQGVPSLARNLELGRNGRGDGRVGALRRVRPRDLTGTIMVPRCSRHGQSSCKEVPTVRRVRGHHVAQDQERGPRVQRPEHQGPNQGLVV